MTDRAESDGGFGVLDGVALVMGAAVASVHIRGVIRTDLAGPGWVLIWGTFSWVALTATGPFLFLIRRFARTLPDYPKVGDWLWALLGAPWIVTAMLHSIATGGDPHDPLFAAVLSVGIAIVSLIAIAVVWATWVAVPPEQATRAAASPWTNRVGLILAVAWPLQCGAGMVVIG